MMTLALGFASAKVTGRRDKMLTFAIAGDARHSARMAEPARPVAPVTMMCAMYAVADYGRSKTGRVIVSRYVSGMIATIDVFYVSGNDYLIVKIDGLPLTGYNQIRRPLWLNRARSFSDFHSLMRRRLVQIKNDT